LLVGRVIFGVHWGNPFTVGLVLFLLSVSYAGASGILGSRARTEEQAISLAVVLGIVCGMLGGCMYPLDVVGAHPRRRASRPAGLGHGRVREADLRPRRLAAVLPEAAALAVFAALLLGLAMRSYARTVYSPG
jgi:ABC-2 type transport system permease protein